MVKLRSGAAIHTGGGSFKHAAQRLASTQLFCTLPVCHMSNNSTMKRIVGLQLTHLHHTARVTAATPIHSNFKDQLLFEYYKMKIKYEKFEFTNLECWNRHLTPNRKILFIFRCCLTITQHPELQDQTNSKLPSSIVCCNQLLLCRKQC